jgi:tetratricopeptide (TPR) repeat protein
MVAASRRLGRIPYVIKPSLKSLLQELQASRPVLVLQNLGLTLWPIWHYAVVIGYSADSDEIILRSGVTQRQILSAHRFLRTWEGSERWAMVLLKPGELPASPEQLSYLKAIAAMERSLPADALISAYQAALVHWKDHPIALYGLAASQHAKGDLKRAEKSYRKLLAQKNNHVAAYNNLAEVLADQGCYKAALGMVNQALQRKPGVLRQHLLETRRDIQRRQAVYPNQSVSCEDDIVD